MAEKSPEIVAQRPESGPRRLAAMFRRSLGTFRGEAATIQTQRALVYDARNGNVIREINRRLYNPLGGGLFRVK